MKKVWLMMTVVVLALALAASGPAEAQTKRFFGIATGGVGGVYYPLGGGLRPVPHQQDTGYDRNRPKRKCLGGQHQFDRPGGRWNRAWPKTTWPWRPTRGTRPPGKPRRCLSCAVSLPCILKPPILSPLKNSGIKSVYDLKGKRVIVGDKGSGTEFDSRRILEALGMTYDDIKPVFVYYATAVQRLQDEQADACIWTSGVPNASMIEIATTKDVVFLDLPEEAMKKIVEKYPYYAPVTMPANAYHNQKDPVKTIGMIALWITPGRRARKGHL